MKDEGRAYAEKLVAAGVKARHIEHASFVHDFYIMAAISPAVVPAIEETAAILREALA